LVGKWGDADPLGVWLLGATYADYDARKLDRMFQDSTGQTPVTASADKVGLWLDGSQFGTKTLAQVLAGQAELVTNTAVDAGGWTHSGRTVIASGSAGSDSVSFTLAAPTAAGRRYLVSIPNNMPTSAFYADFGSGTGSQVGSLQSNITQVILTCTSPGTVIRIGRWSGSPTGTVGPISVKEIPGNHALQATSQQRLNLLISGSRYSLTADATDDNLLSTYLAGPSVNSILIDIDVAASLAATQVIAGMSGSATARLSIGINTSGQLCAGVGSDANTTIVGTTDWRGTRLIAALSADGSTVKLLSATGEEYSAAQNGSPTTTIPARLAANNNNGTASSFFGGGIARAILAQKALDLATFNAIRNQLLAS
jgi:hypothetical protein